ncbi:MAG: ParB/RepB/Spo0J family partition protein [Candidatus Nomurabacteria bacterium]|jgi:ParB family chromosome partitioning protein|nr:ParB/RepB/Spo0J family partition protein [Candidatus Nomurabacteria bacterium]
MRKGLGRGFEALIPTSFNGDGEGSLTIDQNLDISQAEDQKITDLREINITEIAPDPNQPRKTFDEQELQDLANSIKQHGILSPIMLIRNSSADSAKIKYLIVAGERRWRAAKLAQLTKIPALIRDLTDQNRLEISIIENVQRADLNPLEVGTAYLKLREQFNLTDEAIAKKIGKSPIVVYNRIRLLTLPDDVKQAVITGQLTEGQVRPLISIDPKITKQFLPKILNENWSARKIEQLAVHTRQQIGQKVKTNAKLPYEAEAKAITKQLGAKTQITSSSRGTGSITLKFRNPAEFRKIFDKLTKTS